MTLVLDKKRLGMAIYFVNAEWQERKGLLLSDDTLMDVAQFRATDMSLQKYFDHEDPIGYWPNYWVRNYGYKLPEHWDDEANNVESIGKGFTSPSAFMEALYHSDAHRPHVTGDVLVTYGT